MSKKNNLKTQIDKMVSELKEKETRDPGGWATLDEIAAAESLIKQADDQTGGRL